MTTHFRLLLPLAFAAALGGCDAASHVLRREPPAAELESPAPAVALPGELLTDTDALALPARLTVSGGYLVVLDRFGEAPIRLFDPGDGALLASVGRKGAGPGEFEGAWSLDPVGGGPDFWVYDLGLSRLTRIDVNPATGEASADSLVQLVADGTLLQPVRIGGRLISTGFFAGARFGVFDAGGRLRRRIGPPPPGSPEVPAIVRHEAYQGTLAPHPSRSRFAAASRHADRLEIFAADGSLVAVGDRPFGFEPRIQARDGSEGAYFVSDEDLRFGFVDVAATSDAIYALYSGRTRRGFPGRASYAEYIYVYGWDGRLERVLRLADDAIAITVDGASGLLYAIHHRPRPLIARYRLPRERRVVQNSL